MQRKAYSWRQAREFQEFFDVPLSAYFDGLFGFDVVRFDEEVVRPPDGTSCADEIKAKWGQDAHDLVNTLILV